MKSINKYKLALLTPLFALSIGCGAYDGGVTPGDVIGALGGGSGDSSEEEDACDPFDYEQGADGGRCDRYLSIRVNRCTKWAENNMKHYHQCTGTHSGEFSPSRLNSIEDSIYRQCFDGSYLFGIPSEACIAEAGRGCGPYFSGVPSSMTCGGDPSLQNDGADPGL